MNKKLKGLLFGASLLGGSMMIGAHSSVHADTWQPNSIQKIEQEMQVQTKQGQKLVVYVVQRGDTLSGISEAAKVPMKTIMALNHIQNPNVLYIGEKIILGDSSSARAFVESKGQSVSHNAKENTTSQGSVHSSNVNAAVVAGAMVSNGQHTSQVDNAKSNGNVAAYHVVASAQPEHYQNGSQAVTVNSKGHSSVANVKASHNNVNDTKGDHATVSTPHQDVQNNHQGQTTGKHEATTPTKPNPAQDFHPDAQGIGHHQAKPAQPTTDKGKQPVAQPSKDSGHHTTQPSTGAQTTPTKPSTGHQGVTTPSKPTKPVAPTSNQLNAEKVNQIFQNTMSTKYGWHGTWVSEEEGYDGWHRADYDQKSNGYADGVTWAGDKNPNKTLGEGEAKAMHDKWASDGDDYNNFKYGYSTTTVHKNDKGQSVAHTDYYLWNK